jgi:hypothetical protein
MTDTVTSSVTLKRWNTTRSKGKSKSIPLQALTVIYLGMYIQVCMYVLCMYVCMYVCNFRMLLYPTKLQTFQRWKLFTGRQKAFSYVVMLILLNSNGNFRQLHYAFSIWLSHTKHTFSEYANFFMTLFTIWLSERLFSQKILKMLRKGEGNIKNGVAVKIIKRRHKQNTVEMKEPKRYLKDSYKNFNNRRG